MAVGLALLQEAEGYQPYLSGSLIGLGVGFSLSRFADDDFIASSL